MIQTYDDLIKMIRKSKQNLIDIKQNIQNQEKAKMQISETTLYFDFKKNIVKIERISSDSFVQYKSPYIEHSLEELNIMFDFLL